MDDLFVFSLPFVISVRTSSLSREGRRPAVSTPARSGPSWRTHCTWIHLINAKHFVNCAENPDIVDFGGYGVRLHLPDCETCMLCMWCEQSHTEHMKDFDAC
mmetsp:Transcript_14632/g.32420  ORF Transcript_14632/g.32420 Transcript_14632/m.32420 type:complete len:102 (+) Transcript_14632:489-794(+)